MNWILLKERAWRSLKTGNICSSLLQGQAVQPCLSAPLCQGQKGTTGVTLSSRPYIAHETSLNLFVISGTEKRQNIPFAHVPSERTAHRPHGPCWLRHALVTVMGVPSHWSQLSQARGSCARSCETVRGLCHAHDTSRCKVSFLAGISLPLQGGIGSSQTGLEL